MNKLVLFFLVFYSSLCFSDNWIERAKSIVLKYDLTEVKLSCIDFEKEVYNDGEIILITTFELHNRECSGDPETRPKLFFIEFDTLNQVVRSNAKSEVGQLEVLE